MRRTAFALVMVILGTIGLYLADPFERRRRCR